MPQTGRCLCGAVSYEFSAEPMMTAICHCKNCQRQAGSALSILIGLPEDAIAISGEVKTYVDEGASGMKVLRQFCPNCGSPMFSDAESAPGALFIKAGTLDDTSWLAPQIQFWTSTKQDWLEIDGIASVETNPPG
jgi:hypothetical protein